MEIVDVIQREFEVSHQSAMQVVTINEIMHTLCSRPASI